MLSIGNSTIEQNDTKIKITSNQTKGICGGYMNAEENITYIIKITTVQTNSLAYLCLYNARHKPVKKYILKNETIILEYRKNVKQISFIFENTLPTDMIQFKIKRNIYFDTKKLATKSVSHKSNKIPPIKLVPINQPQSPKPIIKKPVPITKKPVPITKKPVPITKKPVPITQNPVSLESKLLEIFNSHKGDSSNNNVEPTDIINECGMEEINIRNTDTEQINTEQINTEQVNKMSEPFISNKQRKAIAKARAKALANEQERKRILAIAKDQKKARIKARANKAAKKRTNPNVPIPRKINFKITISQKPCSVIQNQLNKPEIDDTINTENTNLSIYGNDRTQEHLAKNKPESIIKLELINSPHPLTTENSKLTNQFIISDKDLKTNLAMLPKYKQIRILLVNHAKQCAKGDIFKNKTKEELEQLYPYEKIVIKKCKPDAKTYIHFLYYRSTFIRTIMFNDNPDINYVVVMPKKFYDPIYCNKGYITYYLITENINQQMLTLGYIIKDMDISKVILSCSFEKQDVDFFRRFGIEKIIAMPHGIFIKNYDYDHALAHWNREILYYVGDVEMRNILGRLKFNIKHYPGIPQLDYLLHRKEYIYKYKDEIKKKYNIEGHITYIINGSTNFKGTKYYKDIHNYISCLANNLMKVFKNTTILLKNKITINYTKEKPKVIQVPISELIYNYLGCDLIIVIEGGTSYIESLLVNPNTILYQNGNIKNLFDVNNDYNLLICKNDIEFIECLRTIQKFEVKSDIDSYMKYMFGDKIKEVGLDVFK